MLRYDRNCGFADRPVSGGAYGIAALPLLSRGPDGPLPPQLLPLSPLILMSNSGHGMKRI
jgi:hypothetical protein